MIGAGSLFSKNSPDAAKNAPYECGFSAFESSHIPFDVRFYLVAILFIIFRSRNSLLFSLGFSFAKNWMVWLWRNDVVSWIISYRVYL